LLAFTSVDAESTGVVSVVVDRRAEEPKVRKGDGSFLVSLLSLLRISFSRWGSETWRRSGAGIRRRSIAMCDWWYLLMAPGGRACSSVTVWSTGYPGRGAYWRWLWSGDGVSGGGDGDYSGAGGRNILRICTEFLTVRSGNPISSLLGVD
jgi:hypothetical protein